MLWAVWQQSWARTSCCVTGQREKRWRLNPETASRRLLSPAVRYELHSPLLAGEKNENARVLVFRRALRIPRWFKFIRNPLLTARLITQTQLRGVKPPLFFFSTTPSPLEAGWARSVQCYNGICAHGALRVSAFRHALCCAIICRWKELECV